MKIVKKFSWPAAAIAAAVVVSGVAQADGRDRGHRDHRPDHRVGHYDSRGGDHRRVWRDHGHNYYRHYNNGGYRYSRHPKIRYYDYRPYPRYYGYTNDYYYGSGWDDFGASLTFQFPLR